MPKVKNNVNFRADPDLLKFLTDRQGPGLSLGLSAEYQLRRYSIVLINELRAVNLTLQEACLIVDALNGTLIDPIIMNVLPLEISDAIRLNRLDDKWEVNGKELIAKISKLSFTQCLAVTDAAERFWNLVSAGCADDNQTMLENVGLVRKPSPLQPD